MSSTVFIPFKNFSFSQQQIETDINFAESKFGCKLPESYKKFLFSTNGGVIFGEKFALKVSKGYADENHLVSPDHFFGVYKLDDKYTYQGQDIPIPVSDHFMMVSKELEAELERDDGLESKYFLPVARDQGGNLFVISLNPSNFGSVQYIYKDLTISESLEIPSFTLAQSYEGFISRILEENGGSIPGLSEIKLT